MFAHVDMNSYFASVEQQANPHWRGRPLGVCAYLHKHGCVIAASIEAKKRGAKVGMSLDECRQICPDMVFVQNDPPKYRAVTSKVFGLLHELSDKVEHYSIDEAFLDLDGWYRDAAEASWALCRTRIRIQREIGDWLKCSIGIAPSKFLAKLASDLKKPNGLVIITPENLDETLAALELEDACGIGPRIRRRLNKLGIFSLLDLRHYPLGNLMRVLGKAGWMWQERLRGRDVDRLEVAGERPPKSVGHSFCVPRRANLASFGKSNLILPILIRLTERAGRRLRSFGLLAGSITINAVIARSPQPVPTVEGIDDRKENVACSMAFGEPVNDIFSLTHGVTRLLGAIWDGRCQISFLAVTLHDLVPPNGQIEMPFDLVIPVKTGIQKEESPFSAGSCPEAGRNRMDPRRRHFNSSGMTEKRIGTSKAVDAIRDRYGEESIIFASMMGLERDYAPDRIGFRKTEGVEVFLG